MAAWAANGFFQAFGWAAVTRVFFAWFPDPSSRGALYSVLSTSQNAGAALSAVLIPWAVASAGDWRAAAVVPMAVGLAVAALVAVAVRAEPSPAGKAAVVPPGARPGRAAADAAAGGGLGAVCTVLGDWRQWTLGLAYVLLSVVRSGVADWAVHMLAEGPAGALSPEQAGNALASMELGGFVGGVSAGLISDGAFGGRRTPVMLISAALGAGASAVAFSGGARASLLAAGWGLGHLVPADRAAAVVFFAVGALTFAPHVLLGLTSREISPPGAMSSAGGFVKGLGQLGSALAGVPLSMLQQRVGWDAVALGWSACMVGAAVCFAAVLPAERPAEHTGGARSKQE